MISFGLEKVSQIQCDIEEIALDQVLRINLAHLQVS